MSRRKVGVDGACEIFTKTQQTASCLSLIDSNRQIYNENSLVLTPSDTNKVKKRNVPCMLTVTDVFQLKIHLAEVHSHFGHVRKYSCFMYCCSLWLELCTNLTLGLSQTPPPKKNTTSCSERDSCFSVEDLYV